MRRLFILLSISTFLILVWLAIPLLEGRNRRDEERMLGALQVVEQTIVAHLSQVGHVDAFHLPSLNGPNADNLWTVTGVAVVKYENGDVTRESYVAQVESLCALQQKPECWSVRRLTVGDQSLLAGASHVPKPSPPKEPVHSADNLSAPLDGTSRQLPNQKASGVKKIEIKEYPSPSAPPAWADWQELVSLIQKHLKDQGYDPGPVDGMIGPRTIAAIETFQRDQGLKVDGEASEELLRYLMHGAHRQSSQN